MPPESGVELVTMGEFVSPSITTYGGKPPETVTPHDSHWLRDPLTLALTTKGTTLLSVSIHLVLAPAKFRMVVISEEST